MKTNKALAGAAMAVGLALGGCANDYYGHGYAGVDYGYGYAYPYYGDYYGWWGGYYYPGTGYYVYDRYRRPFYWNDAQRAYWQGRTYHGSGAPAAHWEHWNHAAGAPGGVRPQGFRGGGGGVRFHGGGGHHGHR